MTDAGKTVEGGRAYAIRTRGFDEEHIIRARNASAAKYANARAAMEAGYVERANVMWFARTQTVSCQRRPDLDALSNPQEREPSNG